jgi:hypothetical protein
METVGNSCIIHLLARKKAPRGAQVLTAGFGIGIPSCFFFPQNFKADIMLLSSFSA